MKYIKHDNIDNAIVGYLIILALSLPSIVIVATENIRLPYKYLLVGILCLIFCLSFFMIIVCDGTLDKIKSKIKGSDNLEDRGKGHSSHGNKSHGLSHQGLENRQSSKKSSNK